MFKKIITVVLVLILSLLFRTQVVMAGTSSEKIRYTPEGQPFDKVRISADKDSATADGKDSINIEAGIWSYSGGQFVPGLETTFYLSVSGSGNNYTKSLSKPSGVATKTFTLTSNSAETKTVTFSYDCFGQIDPCASNISIQVTFTSPTTTPTTTTKTTPKTTTPTATQKPSPPTISTINNKQLPENKTLGQIIREGEQITFSGKTSPNVTVKLYIYSEPITAETKSDKDGNWSYTLTQALEPGEHRVEAEVIDEKGNISDKTEIAKFTVKPKIIPVESTEPEKTPLFTFTPLTYSLAGLALVLIGFLIYLIIKRRRAMG